MTHEEAQNSPQTADRGSRALPDATDAGEALVQQIAAAIIASWCDPEIYPRNVGAWLNIARAVLPLVEAQVAPLRDEVAQSRLSMATAREEWAEKNEQWMQALESADAAESALRQVRELADEFERAPVVGWIERLRAILDSARIGAADTQPEGAGSEVVSTGHARAIVQMSEWMERAEAAEAERDALRLALSNEPEHAPGLRAMVEHERETRTPTAGSNGDTAPEAGIVCSHGAPSSDHEHRCAEQCGGDAPAMLRARTHMRRLTINLDIAFGKDEPEPDSELEDTGQMGSADTITERRASDEHAAPQIGFGRGPWIDQ